jgi:hypothetical protein
VFGPFSAGDSLRVYRLQRRGISLDLQRQLTKPSNPLWEAWLAFVTQQAMGQPTYILHDVHHGEGFLQMRYRPHQAAADLTFLAPPLDEEGKVAAVWTRLLDCAGIEAAGRGIQRVFANLPESGGEMELFHQSGFLLYAREEIYRLPPRMPAAAEAVPGLRVQRAEDWPAVQKLCVAITPQRVRQAEGGIVVATGTESSCQRYVLPGENGDEAIAALSLFDGSRGGWLRLLVRPDSSQVAQRLIAWGLGRLQIAEHQPVYCNVRQYESGVRAALEATGFELYATRALMVKHTVAWTKSPAQELAVALKSVEPVPPAYRINGEAEAQAREGRLAAASDSSSRR